jgi:NitT/TauT family transport system substrate-binding protein
LPRTGAGPDESGHFARDGHDHRLRIFSTCRADVQYVQAGTGVAAQSLARGEADLSMNFIGPNLLRIEAGDPAVMLAGGHVGCLELVGTERVRAIHSMDESVRLLTEGKVDAVLTFPPWSQELREKQIGHVLVSTAMDWRWSQYFCCMVLGHREFVRKYPVAMKRALRAILKTAAVCALEPDHAARFLVDRGFAQCYDYALQLMQDIPYGRWQELDPRTRCGSMPYASTRPG